AMASLSIACSSSDGGADGADVPDFALPGATTPTTPGDPTRPGVNPDPSAPPAPGGTTPTGTEGQGDPPLAAPGAPAPGPGGETPAAPVDGMQPPAEPGAPVPAGGASFFSSGAWSGPVIPEGVLQGTTLNPANYDARAEGAPFCLQGQVANDVPQSFRGVARIKFTLSQAEGGAPQAVTPQANGLAFTFTRTTGSLIRVMLHAPAGAQAPTNPDGSPAEGWCYAIPEVEGQVFVPYTAFNTTCYERTPTGAS